MKHSTVRSTIDQWLNDAMKPINGVLKPIPEEERRTRLLAGTVPSVSLALGYNIAAAVSAQVGEWETALSTLFDGRTSGVPLIEFEANFMWTLQGISEEARHDPELRNAFYCYSGLLLVRDLATETTFSADISFDLGPVLFGERKANELRSQFEALSRSNTLPDDVRTSLTAAADQLKRSNAQHAFATFASVLTRCRHPQQLAQLAHLLWSWLLTQVTPEGPKQLVAMPDLRHVVEVVRSASFVIGKTLIVGSRYEQDSLTH